MDERQLQPIIRKLRRDNDRRYAEAAYLFILDALEHTLCLVGKDRLHGEARHVSVRELLEGIRHYAREEFGPLAPYAFRAWGVHSTEDFGNLVFELCDAGILNRRENDRLQDFCNGFDFQEAFEESGSLGN